MNNFVKMNIDEEFDKILLKHGIISNSSCSGLFERIETEVQMRKTFGLYGLGVEAMSLMYALSKIDGFRVNYCYDKTKKRFSYRGCVIDTEVKQISDIDKYPVDVMLIASKNFSNEMTKMLSDSCFDGVIIDCYGLVEDYLEDHYVDYRKVSSDRVLYNQSQTPESLRVLIKDYLLVKDFIHAFLYIDKYVAGEYYDSTNYSHLKTELEELLKKIRDNVNTRKTKDVILNWVDALSYYDLPQFEFLSSHSKKSAFFENAYTVMPWTTETLKTVLYGENPIEGKLFLRDKFTVGKCKLLDLLSESGYRFAYCGLPRMSRFFESDVETPVFLYDNKFSSSIHSQWDTLSLLCRYEEPMFIMIHTLRETHEPFISGEYDEVTWFGSTSKDWENATCQEQARVAGQYIDEQLKFYESFYGDNAIEIYMSDHGRIGNSPMSENKTHINVFVHGQDIKQERYAGFFSLAKMPLLVEKCILGGNLDELCSDYALIENLDAYDSTIVDDVFSGRLSREEMCQCRGVITSEGRYFIYFDGREFYYPGRDNDQNEIGNPIYEDRINQCRNLCGNEFIDIYQYDKFKYSRRLYEGK